MSEGIPTITLSNGSEFNSEELANLRLFPEYSDELLIFAGVSCIIFMVVGIPGNLITIISLARCKKVRNATALFIINMSLADLLFCCINLPLAISTFLTRGWFLGVFLCRFFPFARYILSGVGVFTILAITINRYIMISYPSLYTKLYTSRNLAIQVAFIWITSVVFVAPAWTGVWGRYGISLPMSFCIVIPDANGNSPDKLLFACAFVIPFVAICFCYARIFWIVRKATAKTKGTIRKRVDVEDSSFGTTIPEPPRPKSQADDVSATHPRVQSLRPPSTLRVKVSIAPDELSSASSSMGNFTRAINLRKSQLLNIAPTSKDKRLLTMITVIVIMFIALHLPITIIMLVASESDPTTIIWSYLLRYLTVCINPVIYVVMSHEYRKAYKKAISCKDKPSLPR